MTVFNGICYQCNLDEQILIFMLNFGNRYQFLTDTQYAAEYFIP